MVEEPVPARELNDLHARISVNLAELRRRMRRPRVGVRGDPVRLVRETAELVRSLRAIPGAAARVGVAILAVAGVAALLARSRRGAPHAHRPPTRRHVTPSHAAGTVAGRVVDAYNEDRR